jgi:hypothetical protein
MVRAKVSCYHDASFESEVMSLGESPSETPGHDNTKGQSKSVFGHGKSHQLVIAGKEVHGSSLGLGDALWL